MMKRQASHTLDLLDFVANDALVCFRNDGSIVSHKVEGTCVLRGHDAMESE